MGYGGVMFGFAALATLGALLLARFNASVDPSSTSTIGWEPGRRRGIRVLTVMAGLGILVIALRIGVLWDWKSAAATFVIGTSVGSGAAWALELFSVNGRPILSDTLVRTGWGSVPLLIVFLWVRVGAL